jgi:anti-anti-sigma factor
MTVSQSQFRSDPAFTIERKEGRAPGTVIFRLSGPLTVRKMFESQSPDAVRNLLVSPSVPGVEPPKLNIFDLTGVPYMDSMGMGMIVTEYVRCQGKGVRLIIAGASPRVRELLKLTKVDTVLPLTATVEEADTA